MKTYIARLKAAAEDHPLEAAGIAVLAIGAVTKLMQANTERNNSKTWQKEVDRRTMMRSYNK
jgi:hypothetical protein